MDGPGLSASGRPHFPSRQARLLQPGRLVGRRAGAAVGIRLKPVKKAGASRSDAPDSKHCRAVISWLARATAEEEVSQNLVGQVLEAVSRPAIRLQKSALSSDRCPDP